MGNKALWYLCFIKYTIYLITNWLPGQFKALVISYKILQGIELGYLRNPLTCIVSTSFIQSSRVGMPWSCWLTPMGPRMQTFSIIVPLIWNNTVPEIHLDPTLSLFRQTLKTWLFPRPCTSMPGRLLVRLLACLILLFSPDAFYIWPTFISILYCLFCTLTKVMTDVDGL